MGFWMHDVSEGMRTPNRLHAVRWGREGSIAFLEAGWVPAAEPALWYCTSSMVTSRDARIRGRSCQPQLQRNSNRLSHTNASA